MGGLLPTATRSSSGLMTADMAKRIFQVYYQQSNSSTKIYKLTPSTGFDVSKLYIFTDVGSLSEYIIHKNFVHEIISPISDVYFVIDFYKNSDGDIFVRVQSKSYGTTVAFHAVVPGFNGTSTSFSFTEVSIDISGLTRIEPKKV